MTQLVARYFDGVRAGSRPVTVELYDTNRMRLLEPGLDRQYSGEQIKVESRLGSGPAIVTLSDGGRLEIEDADTFFELHHSRNETTAWVHWLETNWSLVISLAAVTAMLVWFGITYGLPIAAKRTAEAIPAELERKLGEQSLKLLDSAFLAETELDIERQAEVDAIFADVVAAVGADGDYTLLYRQGEGIGANALALPAGSIVITDELIEIAESDMEIAAVLAHEVGHVRERHTLRSVIQSSIVAGLLVVVTGDVGSATNLVATIPTLLIDRSYSRDFEREADTVAFEYLDLREVDGSPLADLLTRIDAQYGGTDSEPSLLDTHPRSGERRR